MNRWRTLIVSGLIVIILIATVTLLWGPASRAISPTFFNGANSETFGPGVQSDQSVVKILKPAEGESFELFEMIEFEWCWYQTLRSTNDRFVIYLTAAHHEQISIASPELIDENCYRFVTTGYDIASLPGEYELQMKIQKDPSNINMVMGSSDSRRIVFLLDGSLITLTPTNTSTPTTAATSTPRKTLTPSQTPIVQATITPNFTPTWTPTSTPSLAPTITPSPTQIPPSATSTQPPPPPPKPTSVPPPPPPATSTPPLPPPPAATNPPPRATPTPP